MVFVQSAHCWSSTTTQHHKTAQEFIFSNNLIFMCQCKKKYHFDMKVTYCNSHENAVVEKNNFVNKQF